MQIIACLLFVAAFAPYVVAIVRGKVQPVKGSWFIWAMTDSITLMSMFLKHTVNGQIVGAVIGAWVVFALVMKYGKPGWTRLDQGCLIWAAIGVVLAFAFSDPLLALAASLSAVFVGGIPTMISAWQDPAKEDKLAWSLWSASCFFALLSIPQYTAADMMQPIVFAAINFTVLAIICIRPAITRS